MVHTNDPQKKVQSLSIKAFVKTSISLSANSVSLIGDSKKKITNSVTIIAKEDKPLELKPSDFNLEEKVAYRIEEVEAGKVFKIHFTSMPSPEGTYFGFLKLKTNYPEKPEINIKVKAKYQKASQLKG